MNETKRRFGYKFCEAHQKEYIKYCDSCAVNMPGVNEEQDIPLFYSIKKLMAEAKYYRAYEDGCKNIANELPKMTSFINATEKLIDSIDTLMNSSENTAYWIDMKLACEKVESELAKIKGSPAGDRAEICHAKLGSELDSRPHHCVMPKNHIGRHFCHICGIYWNDKNNTTF